MHARTAPDPARHSRKTNLTGGLSLERRIAELEQLADSQSRELKTQFERIAQMQAEWDILRIRFGKS